MGTDAAWVNRLADMTLGSQSLLAPSLLLVLSLVLLTTQCAPNDRILPTPDQLASPSSTSSAVSLSIDDIIAQSSAQEAQETTIRKARKPVHAARPTPQNGPKDGSMNSILNWAIEHSDPSVIAEQADAAEKLSVEERKAAFEAKFDKETLAKIFGKSESVKGMSEPIKIIAAATNSSAEEIDTDLLIAALTELQVHAEDIDKANDLHKLGGMEPLYKLLAMKVPPAVTQLALHTLGSAASHNPQVQALQLSGGLMAQLLQLLLQQPPAEEHVQAKVLYAVSALCGNNAAATESLFSEVSSKDVLSKLLQTDSKKLQSKVVSLAHDLAFEHQGWRTWIREWAWGTDGVRIVSKMLGGDEIVDLHDKVLQLLRLLVEQQTPGELHTELPTAVVSQLQQYVQRHNQPESGSDVDEDYGVEARQLANELISFATRSEL